MDIFGSPPAVIPALPMERELVLGDSAKASPAAAPTPEPELPAPAQTELPAPAAGPQGAAATALQAAWRGKQTRLRLEEEHDAEMEAMWSMPGGPVCAHVPLRTRAHICAGSMATHPHKPP